ncbi:MAG: hypothetical protein RLZZ546_3296 [Bacteroidota bacterium]|jgi:L-threonylcarbamoyladenylate synthase
MIGTDINKAIDILMKGDLIGLPTETVYGLAGNAINSHAISKIFSVKNRPSFNPLIIHLSHTEKISDYAYIDHPTLQDLADKFMPGPLTLILNKKENVPHIVTAGSNKVAVRIPSHDLALEVLSCIDFPLAAPSANPFGYISPTTPLHVLKQLGNSISYILDGGACNIGIESTIVGIEENEIVVYRKGGLSIEQIEKVVGRVHVNTHSTSNPIAPGMLTNHYAPSLPLYLGDFQEMAIELKDKRCVALCFSESIAFENIKKCFVLSPDKNFKEAAANLFTFLREIDEMEEIDAIIAELLPEKDLGRAINDRLRRASINK